MAKSRIENLPALPVRDRTNETRATIPKFTAWVLALPATTASQRIVKHAMQHIIDTCEPWDTDALLFKIARAELEKAADAFAVANALLFEHDPQ